MQRSSKASFVFQGLQIPLTQNHVKTASITVRVVSQCFIGRALICSVGWLQLFLLFCFFATPENHLSNCFSKLILLHGGNDLLPAIKDAFWSHPGFRTQLVRYLDVNDDYVNTKMIFFHSISLLNCMKGGKMISLQTPLLASRVLVGITNLPRSCQ